MIGEKEWVPTKKITSVLTVLASLFTEVNDNALNKDAMDLYNKNKEDFKKKV